MDICTIVEFREALLHPDQSFATLRRVSTHNESIFRTHNFVECKAMIARRRAIIYAPITPKAADMARRAHKLLQGIESRALTPFEILEGEMVCGANGDHRCMIMVEYPLRGTIFRKAQYGFINTTLNQGLDHFRSELEKNNISHNNLTGDNIMIDNISAWHCIRQYYFTEGFGGDEAAFESLRESIAQCGISSTLNEPMSPYAIHPACENRVQIKENGLIGFVDEVGNKVVECKYCWASDFTEQRAMVITTDRRMGLIDSFGHEIIAPIYDEVIFDVKTGRSKVALGGKSAGFDYNGNQISDWAEE